MHACLGMVENAADDASGRRSWLVSYSIVDISISIRPIVHHLTILMSQCSGLGRRTASEWVTAASARFAEVLHHDLVETVTMNQSFMCPLVSTGLTASCTVCTCCRLCCSKVYCSRCTLSIFADKVLLLPVSKGPALDYFSYLLCDSTCKRHAFMHASRHQFLSMSNQ